MNHLYDCIIIGGSYAGLSAALVLGRALRSVLVIDSGMPCNRYTPHAQSYLTRDGVAPDALRELAMADVRKYQTVHFVEDKAETALRDGIKFCINTYSGKEYKGRKVLIATGVRDIFPDIPGFEACWGKSVIHCPYCHGYESRGYKAAILCSENTGFGYLKTIRHWNPDLTVFLQSGCTFSEDELAQLHIAKVKIVDVPVVEIIESGGLMSEVILADGSRRPFRVLFAPVPSQQTNHLARDFGCNISEDRDLIICEETGVTSQYGVFAAGDCTVEHGRQLAFATANGMSAAFSINHQLIEEDFIESLLGK